MEAPATARPPLAARLVFALVALALAAAGAAYAWLWMFSNFQLYDDEGYFLLLVRHLLEGRAPYDEVSTVYGPAYLAYRWLLNGVCALPLTTDGVRWTTLAAWMLAALLLAWITRLATRGQRGSGWCTLLAAGGGLLHLSALANEPGHPQDLALLVLLGGLAAFVAWREARPGRAALALGLAVGTLAATKVNLGAFLLLPALLLLLADERRRLAWLGWPVLAATLALPWILMRAHLAQGWAQGLASVAGAGVLSAWIFLERRRTEQARTLVPLLAGVAAAAAAFLAFALLQGATPGGMLRAIVLLPARFTTEIVMGIRVPGWAVSSALGALGLALLARWRGERLPRGLVAAAKLGWGLLLLWSLEPHTDWLIPAFLPGAWLVLLHTPHRAARLPFVLCAPLQALQVFPVSGSQEFLGTILLVPLAAMAIADGCAALGSGRARALAASALAAGLVLFAGYVLAGKARGLAFVYEQQERPALAGARFTRFEESTGARARFLADTLAGSCERFLSVRGDNSQYLWTGLAPSTGVIVSHSWRLFDERQQEELAAAHAGAGRVIVLDNRGRIPADLRAGLPFFRLLERSFRAVARQGADELCLPREAAEPSFASCVLLREGQQGQPAARLDVRWPARAEGPALERVQVANVLRGMLFADSAQPDARFRARLWDGGELLLDGTPGRSVPLERLARAAALRLELPQPLPREHATFTLVRFLGPEGRRILSLPIVLVR